MMNAQENEVASGELSVADRANVVRSTGRAITVSEQLGFMPSSPVTASLGVDPYTHALAATQACSAKLAKGDLTALASTRFHGLLGLGKPADHETVGVDHELLH